MRIGFVISGAASRIAQEMVLLKQLVQGRAFHEFEGKLIIPNVISGSSSGALNAVALNAILLSEGLINTSQDIFPGSRDNPVKRGVRFHEGR